MYRVECNKLNNLSKKYVKIYERSTPLEEAILKDTIPDISQYTDMVLVFSNNNFATSVAFMYVPIYMLQYPACISIDGYLAVSSLVEEQLPIKPHTVTFKSSTKIERFTSFDNLQIWVK